MSPSASHGPSLTDDLLGYLQDEREHLVGTLDGLSEYDVRRPMTPTGTNLLGLVKHVASVELGYLGDSLGRPHGIELTWTQEDAFESADMWARPDESREWLLGVYRQSWAHADASVRELGLEASASVGWWSEDKRETTVGHLVVRMVAETAHHAGHADILRETVDGRAGRDHEEIGDEQHWTEFVAKIQEAADRFR